MTENTPIKDMARALHERIKQCGGARAVFDQLDPRFKATGAKSFEGIKNKEKNKITFKSFEKSFERLLKDQNTIEKMNFGIRGNPLLLTNVFKILGINGFEDLTNTVFEEPDPKGKLFTIDSKVDGLREQINSLDERLETHMRKRSRITVLKAATDFDNVTKRLSGILEGNIDSFIDTVASGTYMNYFKTVMGMMNSHDSGQITNILQIQKHANLLQRLEKENTFLKSLSEELIKKQAGKERRVLYFYWIIYEYSEYCFFLHSLRSYRRFMTGYIDVLGLSDDSNLYTMSPLYVSLLYLTTALQYIKKVAGNSNTNLNDIYDKDVIKRIHAMKIIRSETKYKATKQKYYETMTLKLIKIISNIVKPFVLHEISPQPKSFEKYNIILTKILSLYKKALVDTESSLPMEMEKCSNSIDILKGFFSIGFVSVCGLFRLDNEIIDDFDVLLNDISILGDNTRRDLHE